MKESEIWALIATFPAEFGLWGFPGQRFRIDPTDTLMLGNGMLYVHVERGGEWLAFCKGSAAELSSTIVPLCENVAQGQMNQEQRISRLCETIQRLQDELEESKRHNARQECSLRRIREAAEDFVSGRYDDARETINYILREST